jgi:hypothetical protein
MWNMQKNYAEIFKNMENLLEGKDNATVAALLK